MTIDKKSLINWVGGKRLLRKTIAPLIPKDIKSYVEPFGGGAWVLFYKDKWADLRQNEISPEIIVDNYSRFITEINSNTSYSDDVVKNLLCIWKDFSQKNLPPENLSFIFTSYDMFRLGVEQYLNGNSSLSDYIVGY